MNDINLEQPLDDSKYDETDVNFRAYLSQLSDDHLRMYQRDWTDQQVIEWDGNFRSDGALMLVCCERDIEIAEYRQVLDEHMGRRGI